MMRHRPRNVAAMAALMVLAGVATAAGAAEWSRDDAAHLLRRAGFGGTPAQIDQLHGLGREAGIEYLLAGKLPEGKQPVFPAVKLEPFKSNPSPMADPAFREVINAASSELRGAAGGRFDGRFGERRDANRAAPALTEEERAAAEKRREDFRQIVQQVSQGHTRVETERLRAWWVGRMLQTDRPLEEKMSLFWHGLLTSGVREVRDGNFMARQNTLFHTYALGNYKKLVHEIVYDPAMLRYLDGQNNIVGKPNENLARELMELFTMGEGNGYTEQDIREVARALTGLGPAFDGRGRGGPGGGPGMMMMGGGDGTVARAVVRERAHDRGEKTIFGKTGRYGPDDVIELIFARPEPAEHIARKLWEFFAYPNPSASDLQPVIAAIRDSKYEIAPALRVIFSSPAFYSDEAKFALIKSPVELAVQTMRVLERTDKVDEALGATVERAIRSMDQELLQPPNVRGWVGGDNWITAATLYTRYNVATAMVGAPRSDDRGGGRDMRGGPGGFSMRGGAMNSDRLKDFTLQRVQRMRVEELNAKIAKAEGERLETLKAELEKLRKQMTDAQEANRQAFRDRGPELARDRGGPSQPAPVAPAKLFAQLGESPTAAQLVDATTARLLQRPLSPEKRQAIIDAMGEEPIKFGTGDTDTRVRQIIGLVMSCPEYQVY